MSGFGGRARSRHDVQVGSTPSFEAETENGVAGTGGEAVEPARVSDPGHEPPLPYWVHPD
ncbi:hypothetical protein L6E12_03115 [Actinokineospora sp. PR83]|uniref:hypothetical protein n=1 Tax=Actinokineospora sp. PR83 TaxID=2884908 RepID=UPI001F2A7B04|nr:hypothetical protein [Actinokineospora sp. PR83]MCG8914786.1 hypothetical protein [Actinokineospora sp. PR83]